PGVGEHRRHLLVHVALVALRRSQLERRAAAVLHPDRTSVVERESGGRVQPRERDGAIVLCEERNGRAYDDRSAGQKPVSHPRTKRVRDVPVLNEIGLVGFDWLARCQDCSSSAEPGDALFGREHNCVLSEYESYADVEPGAWTHLRIEVAGTRARLYVNNA